MVTYEISVWIGGKQVGMSTVVDRDMPNALASLTMQATGMYRDNYGVVGDMPEITVKVNKVSD